MAKFVPGRDQEVKSAEPMLEVMVDRANPLGVGKHTFQLVVTDDSGNNSEPAVVSVIVCCRARPGYCILIAQGATQWTCSQRQPCKAKAVAAKSEMKQTYAISLPSRGTRLLTP